MNTLSRALTAHIFPKSETYFALKKCWSHLMNSKRKYELSAAHHLLYLSLMGKDWRKGFTPPTNQRKVQNGALQGWVLFRALYALHMKQHEAQLLAPFDGLVTPEMLIHIRRLMPFQMFRTNHLDEFKEHKFPFEAYAAPEEALQTTLQGMTNA